MGRLPSRNNPVITAGLPQLPPLRIVKHRLPASPYRFHRAHTGRSLPLRQAASDETRNLLNSSGISKLATHLGVTIGPEAIDWTQGAMRALEMVATRLALAYDRQTPASLAKLPAGQASDRNW